MEFELFSKHPDVIAPHPPAHLDEEEAGGRGGVVVDVDGDQNAGDHDEHHQEDAEDEAGVQRVCAGGPVDGAICWHYWKTNNTK